jgi:uncharacterized membrane protein HdeD (DUF308 family)
VRVLVTVIGVIALAIGILGAVAPERLLDFGRAVQTPVALYVIGALRVGLGLVLMRAARVSRALTFRVLGVFVIVKGVLTPLFGLEHTRAVLDWWSTHGNTSFLRAGAGIAAAFGLFLIFAMTPRRSPAERRGIS